VWLLSIQLRCEDNSSHSQPVVSVGQAKQQEWRGRQKYYKSNSGSVCATEIAGRESIVTQPAELTRRGASRMARACQDDGQNGPGYGMVDSTPTCRSHVEECLCFCRLQNLFAGPVRKLSLVAYRNINKFLVLSPCGVRTSFLVMWISFTGWSHFGCSVGTPIERADLSGCSTTYLPSYVPSTDTLLCS
jgi:hypothetical protein